MYPDFGRKETLTKIKKSHEGRLKHTCSRESYCCGGGSGRHIGGGAPGTTGGGGDRIVNPWVGSGIMPGGGLAGNPNC